MGLSWNLYFENNCKKINQLVWKQNISQLSTWKPLCKDCCGSKNFYHHICLQRQHACSWRLKSNARMGRLIREVQLTAVAAQCSPALGIWKQIYRGNCQSKSKKAIGNTWSKQQTHENYTKTKRSSMQHPQAGHQIPCSHGCCTMYGFKQWVEKTSLWCV